MCGREECSTSNYEVMRDGDAQSQTRLKQDTHVIVVYRWSPAHNGLSEDVQLYDGWKTICIQ